jgi:putative membrane protein (TIGR04086 family)
MQYQQNQSDNGILIRSFGIGVLVGFIVLIVSLLSIAVLMTFLDVSQPAVTALSVIAGAIAAFAGGWTSGRISEKRGLMMGAICGLLLFLLVCIVGLILHRSMQMGFLFIKLAAFLFAGMAGGVVGVNRK